MKKLWKVVRIVIGVVLCVVLFINFCMMIERFVLHNDLPEFHGYSQAIVMSGSMEPVFSAGDMLIFKEKEQYAVQDIVIFRLGNSFVTHRIIDTAQDGFVTRGDANNTPDKEILYPEQIEGELVQIIPGVGGVMTFLRTPLGIILLLLLALLMVEGPCVVAALKKERINKKKKEG